MREIHAPPTLPSGAPPDIVPSSRPALVQPDQPLTCPGAYALQADLGNGGVDRPTADLSRTAAGRR